MKPSRRKVFGDGMGDWYSGFGCAPPADRQIAIPSDRPVSKSVLDQSHHRSVSKNVRATASKYLNGARRIVTPVREKRMCLSGLRKGHVAYTIAMKTGVNGRIEIIKKRRAAVRFTVDARVAMIWRSPWLRMYSWMKARASGRAVNIVAMAQLRPACVKLGSSCSLSSR